MAEGRLMRHGSIPIALLAFALAAAPLAAQQAPTLQQRVEARLAQVGKGVRFGLVVATADGRELVAIAPDNRFIPASNTKIFTTAAAYATLDGLDRPDREGGASVRLEGQGKGAPDVILEGHGDARLSSAPDCVTNCLAVLADAVATRTKRVRDVIGDDSFFPDQRWSPGMSWNNIPTRSGTGISALTLDDNELVLRVRPSEAGRPPSVEIPAYYSLDNRAVTGAGKPAGLGFDRFPGSFALRLEGSIAPGSEPQILRVGIDDPAHYAAWRLKALLEARGVKVTGRILVRHRPLGPLDDPAVRGAVSPPRPPRAAPLAALTPLPLADDLRVINKESQNVHAELLLRRLGRERGSGSIADGVAAVRQMIERAGLPPTAWALSDGSGMSTYNRASPRGIVILLRWIAAQPWGAAWRSTLPVGGADGTLAKRFRGTPLEKRIFAKTGSLNATSALSGYLTARSGRTLIFSAFANDIPEGLAATEAIDAALVMIAEAN